MTQLASKAEAHAAVLSPASLALAVHSVVSNAPCPRTVAFPCPFVSVRSTNRSGRRSSPAAASGASSGNPSGDSAPAPTSGEKSTAKKDPHAPSQNREEQGCLHRASRSQSEARSGRLGGASSNAPTHPTKPQLLPARPEGGAHHGRPRPARRGGARVLGGRGVPAAVPQGGDADGQAVQVRSERDAAV